jgi:hypothetical protein
MSDKLVATPPANGLGAAALVAASIGVFLLGVLAVAGDALPTLARALTFWKPTGPLSGVTDIAVIGWLISWGVLARLWMRRNLPLRWINLAAALLFTVGLLLTFPPFMDFLQGR